MPVVCGRVAALIGRLTQGVLPDRRARLQIYVDDPIFLFLGSQAARDRNMAIVVCLWLVIGLRLRTFAGKANYVAGVIDAWRPFLADIYGVIGKAGQDSSAPNGCVWTKQWRHASLWFRAFFSCEKHALRREFRLSTFLGKGLRVRIIFDACP